MQPTASYTEPNEWYRNMFAANIKTEPGTNSDSNYQTQQNSPESTSNSVTTHLENYLKQQQQQFSNMDTSSVIDMPADQQQQFLRTAEMHQQLMQQHQYQQHFQQAQKAAAHNQIMSHLPTGFNPLTPPGLPHAIIPAMSHFYNQCTQQQQQQQRMSQQTPSPKSLLESVEKTSLTPRLTPPMDITPPKSPKVSNDSISETEPDLKPNFQNERKVKIHDTEADEDDDGDEIDNIHLPTFNSHGKIKNHKCKTCGKTLHTKLAFWDHCKIHMKPEKILQCAKCPFVTELKHHLEYHIRKHKNLKPFKCDKCSYSCVNKSMLNSHRKSHSSVYQYRCADCDYATKYCHSFKLHLRKYNHKPGMVLDEDGLPNPSIIIDVYGTRRGPKNKAASVAKMRKTNDGLKLPIATQMSVAALENMCLERQKQMSVSPAPSNSSEISESLGSTPSMTLQQHEEPSSILQPQSLPLGNENNAALNILPPMMPLAQLKSGISFYSLWEMLAAQLSPRIREHIQNNFLDKTFENQLANESANCTEENTDGGQEYPEFGRKSVDSAMDLSQGTPNKEEQQQITPDFGMNLQTDIETPVNATSCSSSAAKRKGRVLKLDQEKEKLKDTQNDSATTTPQHDCTTEMPLAPAELINKIEDHVLPNDTTETRQNSPDDPTHNQTHASNPTSTNTASSSGNSSNSSSANFNSANTTANSSPATTPTMYECKYCDIFFKDAVLYTIHMGYHSCDDAFKCNMCGEKCEGPVGLFVHMARNAHS